MEILLMGREVKRVYRGQNGKCCCGCAGKYREDEGSVRRAIREIEAARSSGEDLDLGGTYVALEKGSRILIAYFE